MADDFFDVVAAKKVDHDDFFERVKNAPPPIAKPDPNKIIKFIDPASGQKVPDETGRRMMAPAPDSSQSLPAIGGMMAGIPGAAAGAAIKQAVAKEPSLTELATDTAIQGLVPAVAGKVVGKGIQAIAKASPSIKNLINTGKNAEEIARVEKINAAKEAEVGAFNTAREETATTANATNKANFEAAKTGQKETIGNLQDETKLRLSDSDPIMQGIVGRNVDKLTAAPSRMIEGSIGDDVYKAARGQLPLKKVEDRAFSNVGDLRQLKLMDPGGVEQLGINRAIRKGFSGGKINPDKILSELDNGIYKEALSPEAHSGLSDLMTSLKTESERVISAPEKVLPIGDKMKFKPEAPKLEPVDANILSYSKGKILLSLPALAIAPVLGVASVAKAAGGIVLGEAAIAKLIQSPKIAQVAIAATKAPLGSPQSEFLTRILMGSLSGTKVKTQDAEGNDLTVQVGPKGDLQPSH